MRSLILSVNDNSGGAARATYRLHTGLLAAGAESRMLVWRKFSQDARVSESRRSRIDQFVRRWSRDRWDLQKLDKVPLRRYAVQAGAYFSSAWFADFLKYSGGALAAADVINLHWIGDGFLRPESFRRLRRPLVWTLHDMHAFTGGCHYAGTCNRYTGRCGMCPLLNSSSENDLTRHVWNRKQRHWSGVSLTIVCPSKWLADCARRSSLLAGHRIEYIPYGLDLNQFRNLNKKAARSALHLPQDKKLILFGAIGGTASPRKGFPFLRSALESLHARGRLKGTELLIFGEAQRSLDLKIPAHFAGVISDDSRLNQWFAAADVYVLPSQEDNLPNTILEACASETPVVTFAVGGIPDVVGHQKEGYLAKPFEVEDLARGIDWVLSDNLRRPRLGRLARKKILGAFTQEHETRAYLNLFQELIESQPRKGAAFLPVNHSAGRSVRIRLPGAKLQCAE